MIVWIGCILKVLMSSFLQSNNVTPCFMKLPHQDLLPVDRSRFGVSICRQCQDVGCRKLDVNVHLSLWQTVAIVHRVRHFSSLRR